MSWNETLVVEEEILNRDLNQHGRGRIPLDLGDENLLRGLMTSTSDNIYFKDRSSRFVRMNDAMASWFGLASAKEGEGKTDADFFSPEHARQAFDDEQRVMATGQPVEGLEEKETWPDGSVTWVSTSKVPIRDAKGEVIGLLGISRDITEQRRLEEQIRASQRMDAIGRLAGGVAHDFNNMVGVILGYGEMVLRRLEEGSALHAKQLEVLKAAHRAAGLTTQLLAFGRKQVMQPKVLDLNNLVCDMGKMLHRLIGEDLELSLRLQPEIGSICADPGQVGQIIMNLVVNARDAMPKGGRLTLETVNVALDADGVADHTLAQPGPYVMLAVSDTGCGMTSEVRSHIFEPFYTTKEVDKGTGLGLSTVYGIVKQSGGYIWVYSEPGIGTTFKIYFPRVDSTPELSRDHVTAVEGGTETILLVEDEPALGNAIKGMLEAGGYTVLLASDGAQALQIADAAPTIDLLIVDVIMPGMNGCEVAEAIAKRKPHTRTILLSGYTREVISRSGGLRRGASFLSKPFSSMALLFKCREVLDRALA